MLEVEGIDVFYGDLPALRHLTLRVGEGEIVALVGSNGAGKTTTLRTISGLMRPCAGTIRYDNGELALQGKALELAENAHVRKAYLGI